MAEQDANAQDSAQSEEDIDIELEPEQPRRTKRGRGVGTLIVVVILVALIVFWIMAAINSQRKRQEQIARQQREQQYEMELRGIHSSVITATQAAKNGNIAKALSLLDDVTQKLGSLADRATAEGDSDYAANVIQRRKAALAAATAIREKFDELKSLAIEQLAKVEIGLPPVATSRPQTPAEGKKASQQPSKAPAAPQQPPARTTGKRADRGPAPTPTSPQPGGPPAARTPARRAAPASPR